MGDAGEQIPVQISTICADSFDVCGRFRCKHATATLLLSPPVRRGAEPKEFTFTSVEVPTGVTSEEPQDPRACPVLLNWMRRTQKSRMGRPGGHAKSDQQQQRPMEEAACGKIIVRLRPVLKHELAAGEGSSASATERGYVTTRSGGLRLEIVVYECVVGRKAWSVKDGTQG